MSSVSEFFLPPSAFGRPETQAVRASGTTVTFADGHEALCGTSGLWNVNLGYGNARIAAAIAAAARDASYLSLFRYGHSYASQAATELIRWARPHVYTRVLYSTAGGAAVDASIKLVRQYSRLRGQRRQLVVSLRGGYHGLTFGAMGLTGDDLDQAALGVEQRLVRQVSPTDPDQLAALLAAQGDQIAAIVLEPVLGSGARTVAPELIELALSRRATDGYLVVADEVATGFARTGPMFASHDWPAQPDLLVSSKGLTNGTCAASAVLLSQPVATAYDESGAVLVHGETQAGTPVSCAAISATLAEFERLDALARGGGVAAALDTALADLATRSAAVVSTPGRGCFRAVELAHSGGRPFDAAEIDQVVADCRRAGAIVHPGPSCIQLLPALTYDLDDLDVLLQRVSGVVDGLGGR